jgi:hypothetical protein
MKDELFSITMPAAMQISIEVSIDVCHAICQEDAKAAAAAGTLERAP